LEGKDHDEETLPGRIEVCSQKLKAVEAVILEAEVVVPWV